ncbi:uncharacterized protein RHTO_01133 [Rhodotorula toruloides NP11]|nr:uncharacterized protein RHTO_01133 [Rhodotorula toruloides NP11]EMS21918.1 hypothetical protein RHTO_01133 [Rhodotorula toruloides NP11]
MSLPSLVPRLYVDVNDIPPLIPKRILKALYPYSSLFPHVVDTRTDCPPWTAELEAYFQTFHWQVWVWLTIDCITEEEALQGLRARLGELEQSRRAQEADEGATREDLRTAITLIEARQRLRWERLYGLWDAREKFLARFDNGRWRFSTKKAIAAALGTADFKHPEAAEQSLWPISEPPEDDVDVIRLTEKDSKWTQYAIPATPPAGDSVTENRSWDAADSDLDDEASLPVPDHPWRESDAVPLLAAPVNGARSSGFSLSFSGLLRHRSPQAVYLTRFSPAKARLPHQLLQHSHRIAPRGPNSTASSRFYLDKQTLSSLLLLAAFLPPHLGGRTILPLLLFPD